ncbi:MAG TPA: DUF2997 domain-containing protein [Candidatus Paenibacillus intestinavium]|nr:DUF2997 domain-containing protein [Candidatus Paenibacillus intestinavium]
MEKRIEILCKSDGTFEIEAFGFEGNGCEQATREFEEILSNDEIQRKRKQEYFNVNTTTHQSTNVKGG